MNNKDYINNILSELAKIKSLDTEKDNEDRRFAFVVRIIRKYKDEKSIFFWQSLAKREDINLLEQVEKHIDLLIESGYPVKNPPGLFICTLKRLRNARELLKKKEEEFKKMYQQKEEAETTAKLYEATKLVLFDIDASGKIDCIIHLDEYHSESVKLSEEALLKFIEKTNIEVSYYKPHKHILQSTLKKLAKIRAKEENKDEL